MSNYLQKKLEALTIKEQLDRITAVSKGGYPHGKLAEQLEASFLKNTLETISTYLYQPEVYQIRMVAVFLFGKLASDKENTFSFIKNNVSKKENLRVQEILAMAFDNYYASTGYEIVLPDI